MLEKAIEKTGVKFLGWSENGFRELTTSKGPIEKPEDMKGMKLRVCGTPIFIDIFSSLGANPQAINWSEAVTGFQQGIVDGQENPTNGINVPTKVWQWHKYSTDWHYRPAVLHSQYESLEGVLSGRPEAYPQLRG